MRRVTKSIPMENPFSGSEIIYTNDGRLVQGDRDITEEFTEWIATLPDDRPSVEDAWKKAQELFGPLDVNKRSERSIKILAFVEGALWGAGH